MNSIKQNIIDNKIQSYLNKNDWNIILLDIAFLLFTFTLVFILIKSIFYTYGYKSWMISEFLINYQDGFVRRGLIGEIIFLFVQKFNMDIAWTIKIICLFSLFFVCIFFVKFFKKNGFSLYMLPLCFFLSAGILSHNWIRKDYLILSFFIAILLFYNKFKLNRKIKFFLINVLGVFIILCHEVFAFIAIPILFLLITNHFSDKGLKKSMALSLLAIFPMVITFFLTLHFHGNQENAEVIWNSWSNYFKTKTYGIGEAVSALGWTSSYAMNFHFKRNFLTVENGIISICFWLIIFPVVYYIASNSLMVFTKNDKNFTAKDKTNLSSLLFFQLICLSPLLLVLSCDYLRINFYWITSSFAIFLIIPKNEIEILFPKWFISITEKINAFLINLLNPSKASLVLLMFFIGVPDWGFSFEMMYKNTMIYNILTLISKPLIILKDLLNL